MAITMGERPGRWISAAAEIYRQLHYRLLNTIEGKLPRKKDASGYKSRFADAHRSCFAAAHIASLMSFSACRQSGDVTIHRPLETGCDMIQFKDEEEEAKTYAYSVLLGF